MDFGYALMQMFPDLQKSDFEVVMLSDGTVEITKWDYASPKPSNQDVIDHWNNSAGLQKARDAKLAELTAACEQAVSQGFTSSALGAAHTYPSHDKAQSNFNTEMHRFLTDPNYTQCDFYTVDAGFLTHTKDQFFKVFADGHDAGNAQWEKFKGLAAQVQTATTVDAVSIITWS